MTRAAVAQVIGPSVVERRRQLLRDRLPILARESVDLATHATHRTIVKISATAVEWQNELVAIMNELGETRRWHPQKPRWVKALGPLEDYCEVYEFPCCGRSVIVADEAPSQFRTDGCEYVS